MARKSASVFPLVITSSFMSMVGAEQNGGSSATALNQAGLETMPPELALTGIALELVPSTLAKPAGVMLTSEELPEVQTTVVVMSCVEVSAKVPIAVNCCCPCKPSETLAGVKVID